MDLRAWWGPGAEAVDQLARGGPHAVQQAGQAQLFAFLDRLVADLLERRRLGLRRPALDRGLCRLGPAAACAWREVAEHEKNQHPDQQGENQDRGHHTAAEPDRHASQVRRCAGLARGPGRVRGRRWAPGQRGDGRCGHRRLALGHALRTAHHRRRNRSRRHGTQRRGDLLGRRGRGGKARWLERRGGRGRGRSRRDRGRGRGPGCNGEHEVGAGLRHPHHRPGTNPRHSHHRPVVDVHVALPGRLDVPAVLHEMQDDEPILDRRIRGRVEEDLASRVRPGLEAGRVEGLPLTLSRAGEDRNLDRHVPVDRVVSAAWPASAGRRLPCPPPAQGITAWAAARPRRRLAASPQAARSTDCACW